nr:hypothetical protein [Tanacetum cinerariifolium]
MMITFADTHNMVAYLNKSDASEGFNQIIDFLNGSYVAYALTVNPTIYMFCIKQLWNTVAFKQSNDVTRLQALVNKKKVVVTEATIRDALHLDDAEGVECLPNEEIFSTLARIARELENQGAAEEQGANNTTVDDAADQSIQSPTPLTSPPQQPQDIPSTSQVQSPPPQQQSLPLSQPQGAYFPMSLLQEALDACVALTRRVEHLEHDKRIESSDDTLMEDVSNQGRVIDKSDKNEGAKVMNETEEKETEEVRVNPGDAQVEGRQADIYHIDMDHATKVLKVVVAVSETVSVAAVVQADVPAAVMTTAAPVKVVVPSTRRRKGVVIRDPEEESSLKTPTETKSKDKGKGIMEVEMDHVKQKAKENPYVQRYQVMKKGPQTEAQAQRNMMVYLKNTAGFTLDYFKGMTYDDIHPIFEAKFNANMEFLLKSKEQLDEEKSRAIAFINETLAQKAAKRRKLNEESEDVEELKQHLEIVPDEDDDVFIEATPLARKVPVMDYQIVHVNNKPRYKIIRADDTHQLYRSFITMLKIFDREDIETLWNIIKESAAEKNDAAKSSKDC